MQSDQVLFNDWHVVAEFGELKIDCPKAVRVLGEDLVVWRSADGVGVWRDRCTHRGVKLSLGTIRNDHLICPYHGWEYRADGVCVHYPAHRHQQPSPRARATTFHAKLRYGLVWVCLGEPAYDIPSFPEADMGTHHVYFGGTFTYETSGPRAIENFLDVSHFPFVHSGILGAEPHTEIKDYDVAVTDAGIAVTNVRIWQPKPTNTLDIEGLEVGYEYYVERPLTARLTKNVGITRRDGAPATEAIVLTVTPVEPERCLAWVLVASNYDEQYGDADVKSFTNCIIGQDVRVVESQRPKLLPLDMGAELHVRSDRTAVEYRRWLKASGVTFGTTAAI